MIRNAEELNRTNQNINLVPQQGLVSGDVRLRYFGYGGTAGTMDALKDIKVIAGDGSSTLTDINGHFSFSVDIGTWYLTAEKTARNNVEYQATTQITVAGCDKVAAPLLVINGPYR